MGGKQASSQTAPKGCGSQPFQASPPSMVLVSGKPGSWVSAGVKNLCVGVFLSFVCSVVGLVGGSFIGKALTAHPHCLLFVEGLATWPPC